MKTFLFFVVLIFITLGSYCQNNSFNSDYYQKKAKAQYIYDTSRSLKERIDTSILHTKDLILKLDLQKAREDLKAALNSNEKSTKKAEQALKRVEKKYNRAIKKHNRRIERIARKWNKKYLHY